MNGGVELCRSADGATMAIPISSFLQPTDDRSSSPTATHAALHTQHLSSVDVLVEGAPSVEGVNSEALALWLEQDAEKVISAAQRTTDKIPGLAELSIVLCDDVYIQELNRDHRGKDASTDVLSFPMGSVGDFPVHGELPVMLGDLIISLDTAHRQAAERGHTLQDECRVLLVHGLLHLLGYDHELGEKAHAAMAAAEACIMSELSWKGEGLIAAAGQSSETISSSSGTSLGSTQSRSLPGVRAGTRLQDRQRDAGGASEIKLLALDMDGTLLDSKGQCLPSSVKAIEAAIAKGVFVCLATGKARPAAIRALTKVGLAGKGKVVSKEGPGIFLQGLAVYDRLGVLEKGKNLEESVVQQAFLWALENDVPLAGFTGDEAVTLKMKPELEELHTRYYEPLAVVQPSMDALLGGLPVKKLLFMTEPARIEGLVKPHWMAALNNSSAETTQACPDMLEVVSAGVNKWTGMRSLMASLGIPQAATMAMGDGMNDYPIVSQAAIGVAMGNAQPEVKAAATCVVSDNNSGGIAEALERFILSTP
ncbi:hypothetical protein WJX84_002155 [Apatococcus fuscideae]|uniref:Uncharacterized protein n=1 Tax=Apatococcus fuscideae TaxID=2026836 RepID=A0AAW1TF94_9CHLO